MSEQEQAENVEYFIEKHGYSRDDFLEPGEEGQYNGFLLVDESDSGKTEKFDTPGEMNQSDWLVHTVTGVSLADGTILYEGRPEPISQTRRSALRT